ncbi:MAG: C40 family peptidase [Actinomycetota bacterium]|nr:C40 family peptidase [Actinomycetota bacterium]
MAIRLSRCIKLGVVAPAALSAVLLLIPAAFAAPEAPSPPTVGSVQQQLSALALQNTQLIEQFDHAQIDVQATQRASEKAAKAAQAAQATLDQANTLVAAIATSEYENGAFSTAGALLSCTSGQRCLDDLQTLQAMSSNSAKVISQVSKDKAAADASRRAAMDLFNRAAAKLVSISKLRETVQARVNQQLSLLASLTFSQRAAYQQATSPSFTGAPATTLTSNLTATAASKAAITAVRFALAQVGKPYVWGASGPGSYDCSGLTMASWAAAGVSLPHSSEAQFSIGQPVGITQLLPGDLLFFYGPSPSHVTIYIGGGLMVSAPTEGQNVLVTPLSLFSADYSGARRVG